MNAASERVSNADVERHYGDLMLSPIPSSQTMTRGAEQIRTKLFCLLRDALAF